MTSDPPPPTPPPPPGSVRTDAEEPSPPRVRWLQRSRNDRYLAGVAGGLGESLQFDPMLARIGLVGVTMFLAYAGEGLHPLALVPYFLAWAFVPQPDEQSLVRRIRERAAVQELAGALVLVAIGVLVLSDTDYAFAVGLAALALALFSDRTRRGTEPDLAETPKDIPHRSLSLGNVGLGEGFLRQRTPRPPRREPALWPLTLSLLVLVGIVAILVDRFRSPGIDPGLVVNMALIVIGSVLLLSYWRGRARVTILWALLLVPFWIAFSVADVGRFEGQGTARDSPTSADSNGVLDYELGYGDLRINLQNFEFAPGSETTLKVGVTAGGAYIQVPRDVSLQVRGKVGLGDYTVRDYFYWSGSEPLLNGQIRRSYAAGGIDCERWEISEPELSGLAARSGVDLVEGVEVAEAIAAAGFDRPEFAFTDVRDQWIEDELGGEIRELVEVDFYLAATRFGALCASEPAPANPAVLIIEPTIGVGTLEIQRVDV